MIPTIYIYKLGTVHAWLEKYVQNVLCALGQGYHNN